MSKIRIIGLGLVGASLIAAGGVGIASAESTNANVGSSGIPRTVFRQERQTAAAEVLGTTTAAVQAAHKAKTFPQLISQAGLTKKTYAEKLKAQLTTDLITKGYSQDQVTIALQQRTIKHLSHHDKKAAASSTTSTTSENVPAPVTN